jgi:hypothetical protein
MDFIHHVDTADDNSSAVIHDQHDGHHPSEMRTMNSIK